MKLLGDQEQLVEDAGRPGAICRICWDFGRTSSLFIIMQNNYYPTEFRGHNQHIVIKLADCRDDYELPKELIMIPKICHVMWAVGGG